MFHRIPVSMGEIPYITAIVELEEGPKMGDEHRRSGTGAGESEHRDGAEGGFHEDQRRLHVAEFHAGLISLRALPACRFTEGSKQKPSLDA